jgi:heat shock protein HtpX
MTMLPGRSVATVVGLPVSFLAESILDEVPLGFLISWVLSSAAQLLVLVFVFVFVFVFAISRYREYVADEQAADHTDPRVLASALETIAAAGRHERAADVDTSVAALCTFEGKRGLLDVLLSTHPTPEKRIGRLQSMA